MFIILIAHIPGNGWANWIPARFGFSDAADLFVFCSGMASALAFGGVFERSGWLLGAGRIAHRIWQVYWAHIASFFLAAALLAAADGWFGTDRYVSQTILGPLFDNTRSLLPRIMTLSYLPHNFEILPLYLVILCMIPVVMALARVHLLLVAAWVGGLWIAASAFHVNLPAEPGGARQWFFNPLGWQLVFFTGFALMRGWLPAPPRDGRIFLALLAFVMAAVPFSCQAGFSCHAGWGMFPALGSVHEWLQPVIAKTDYGVLRYLHFMATVYLAWYIVGEHGRRLHGAVVDIVRKVGQQTLAVFLTGLVAAHALGIVLDLTGRGFVQTFLVNLAGIAILVAAAFAAGWFKSSPWRGTSPRPA